MYESPQATLHGCMLNTEEGSFFFLQLQSDVFGPVSCGCFLRTEIFPSAPVAGSLMHRNDQARKGAPGGNLNRGGLPTDCLPFSRGQEEAEQEVRCPAE